MAAEGGVAAGGAVLPPAGLTARAATVPRCADDDVPVREGTRARAERATVCVINKLRRRRGRRALAESAQLHEVARDYAAQMTAERFFSHIGSDGSTMTSRVRASGYLDGADRWALGENLAWGTESFSTPRAIVQAWMDSPVHRTVLLRRKYHEAGLAIAVGAPVRGVSRDRPAGTYVHQFGRVTRG